MKTTLNKRINLSDIPTVYPYNEKRINWKIAKDSDIGHTGISLYTLEDSFYKRSPDYVSFSISYLSRKYYGDTSISIHPRHTNLIGIGVSNSGGSLYAGSFYYYHRIELPRDDDESLKEVYRLYNECIRAIIKGIDIDDSTKTGDFLIDNIEKITYSYLIEPTKKLGIQ